jgi:hypothetical protein
MDGGYFLLESRKLRWAEKVTHLAGRGGEGALLEEVEGLTSGEHGERCGRDLIRDG